MATCTTPSSSLMHMQDFTPSILPFKSSTLTFSLCPLVPCPQRVSKSVVAALPLKRDRFACSVFVEHMGLKLQIRSNRFLEIQKLREAEKEYDLETAISLLKETASTKFVETAEAHFRLNIKPKYNNQQLRATVSLPKGTGKPLKVAVLAQGYDVFAGEKFDEARKAGADIVGGDDLIQQIRGGFLEFDKILGPRKLMPSLRAGTVTDNIPQAIKEFRKGKVEYRADITGIVHIPFGKADFSEDDLLVNFLAIVESIRTNKPEGAVGGYWKTAHICTSMGPSIRLNIKEMVDYKPPSNI
ncbi:hypothetical protein GQ457_06G033350 [Hibiscus cannabinus]